MVILAVFIHVSFSLPCTVLAMILYFLLLRNRPRLSPHQTPEAIVDS